MQSESIDKSDYQFLSSRHEEATLIKFRVLFGEFCLLQKDFAGQVIKPDIFADSNTLSIEELSESDIADLAHVVSAPCDPEHQTGVSVQNKRLIYTYKKFNRMYVDVSGDYQSYLSTFRKKSLSSLNRKIKKAEKSNAVVDTIRNFSKPSEVREFVKLAKPISAQSYQEAQLGTVFRTDEEWIHELQTLARNNRFRGYVLYANDQPVAYNYCPVYGNGVLLYDLSGYLPDSNRYSPGTLLQAHIIQQSFNDESINFYDLCEGEGRHKEQFATGFKTCFSAYVFPTTANYRALVAMHRTLDQLSDTIVSLMKQLGLKDRIKKYLRRK